MSKKSDIFKYSLQVEIYSCLKEIIGPAMRGVKLEWVDLTVPKDDSFGDYTTTIALKIAKEAKLNPLEIAENISKKLKVKSQKLEELGIEKVEFKAPGFVNFYLSKQKLISNLDRMLDKDDVLDKNSIGLKELSKALSRFSNNIKLDHSKENGTILVEYAHPNTHKEFHIGHLRNITLSESLIRLLENLGLNIVRVNYQGDVGMHIAKALWALLRNSKFNPPVGGQKSWNIYEKVEFLGKAYVEGNKAYEEDQNAKKEIIEINRKIYAKDPEVFPLWQETRQWSLDYFESIYTRVGSHFKRYYFESEVHETGKKTVEEYLKKGVFEKSDSAVIFPGEKYGLHNRVFITSEGFPTYEGKEMGLGPLQFNEFHPDLIIHVVGPEQAGYFQVVFKALEKILPESEGRQMHFIYGWVQLKEGKMSSRRGNVVTGRWLLDEAKKRVLQILSRTGEKYSEKEKQDIAEKVAVGAVKYSMLKFSAKSDILFDFDESVSLEGDCGPYIMYTYARTQSVWRKFQLSNSKIQTNFKFNDEEMALLRTIYKFPEVVKEAGLNFAPNLLCSYLFNLSQKYNLFYQKHSILSPPNNLRIALTQTTGKIIKRGLYLLGIEAVSQM